MAWECTLTESLWVKTDLGFFEFIYTLHSYIFIYERMILNHKTPHIFAPYICAGYFSPAILLESFVHEAGPSLSTLTSLSLLMEEDWPTGNSSTAITAALSNAMTTLVGACLALTAFSFHGHMCPKFLRHLGEMCPQLKLAFVDSNPDHQEEQLKFMLLLPSLLPHVTSLTFENRRGDYESPNMSSYSSITSPNVYSFTFSIEAEWLCLPPNLKHLHCFDAEAWPPASSDAEREREIPAQSIVDCGGGQGFSFVSPPPLCSNLTCCAECPVYWVSAPDQHAQLLHQC